MAPTGILVIYDGGCPFCLAYVRLLRLREMGGELMLLSARESHPLVIHYQQQGIDLNDGLLVAMDGATYTGADAMTVLAACSTAHPAVNRFNRALFASRWRAHLLYPVLKAGRRLGLWLLRRPLIASHAPAGLSQGAGQ